MSQIASAWLVIVLALIGANLPFFNTRILSVYPPASGRKPFWMRLLEMGVFYVLVGIFALWLESRAGQNATQGWEFYATTAALFITLAFPGFVYCYLIKHRA